MILRNRPLAVVAVAVLATVGSSLAPAAYAATPSPEPPSAQGDCISVRAQIENKSQFSLAQSEAETSTSFGRFSNDPNNPRKTIGPHFSVKEPDRLFKAVSGTFPNCSVIGHVTYASPSQFKFKLAFHLTSITPNDAKCTITPAGSGYTCTASIQKGFHPWVTYTISGG